MNELHSIDVASLARALRTAPILVEVLPPKYFEERHLPGARNLPLEDFDRGAARVLPDRDAPIVVYCSGPTCSNSSVAARRLRALGYGDVRVFEGGKVAWEQAGLPFDTSEPAATTA